MSDILNCPCRECLTLALCINADRQAILKRNCSLLRDYFYEHNVDDHGCRILREDNVGRCIILFRVLKADFWRPDIEHVREYYNDRKRRNQMPIEDYPVLVKCIEGGRRDAVKNAINVGNALLAVKATVDHGEWIPFMKEHFSVSTRYCQNCMYLAKNPIQEKHYRLGTEELLRRLRTEEDLSV